MANSMEIITSRQNKTISFLSSLQKKKAREEEKTFIFDGIKLLSEAIKNGAEIYCVVINSECADNVLSKLQELYGIDILSLGHKILYAIPSVFERLTDERSPEGVVCAARFMENIHKTYESERDISVSENERILMLESVRDPQNIGAIIRSARAFNVDRIIMSSDCADIYSAKTVRASMGNVFGIRIDRVDSIPSAILSLKAQGRAVYAAALDENAKRLGEDKLESGSVVVIGNEGHGLTPDAIGAATGTIYIPMAKGVESLNAGVAASVLMWEFFGK